MNCQSKSICSSPIIDPWMCSSLQDFAGIKAINTSYALPPVNTITDPFHSTDMISYFENQDQELAKTTVAKVDGNIVNNLDYDGHKLSKPHREFKNVWATEEAERVDSLDDNIAHIISDREYIRNAELQTQKVVNKEIEYGLQCKWKNCFQLFDDQSMLVDHIENNHVEVKKWEDFSCF